MNSAAIVSVCVLALTYFLILSGRLSQALGAFLGAVTMMLAGVAYGFYSPHEVAEVIDVDTVWLLSGMMIIVGLLQRTGFFQFLAIKVAKWSKGNPLVLFLLLALASAVVSMFLDNVTTMLAFFPVTLSIAEVLGISPLPLILGETMGADLGGVFTLIGDPPNMIIGSAGRLTFTDFLTHAAPVALASLAAAFLFLVFRYRKFLRSQAERVEILRELDEHKVLTDRKAMVRLLPIFACVILLFVAHAWLRVTPGLIALAGAAGAIVSLRPKTEAVLESIDWELLIFLLSLFVVVGGLNRSGALPYLARKLSALGHGSLTLLALLFFWGAGLLSLLISAVPATVAFVPMVQELGALGVPVNPLWWALALGIGVASPATPFATTANIVVVNLARHSSAPLNQRSWLGVGIPVYLVAGLTASVLLWLAIRTGWFM